MRARHARWPGRLAVPKDPALSRNVTPQTLRYADRVDQTVDARTQNFEDVVFVVVVVEIVAPAAVSERETAIRDQHGVLGAFDRRFRPTRDHRRETTPARSQKLEQFRPALAHQALRRGGVGHRALAFVRGKFSGILENHGAPSTSARSIAGKPAAASRYSSPRSASDTGRPAPTTK